MKQATAPTPARRLIPAWLACAALIGLASCGSESTPGKSSDGGSSDDGAQLTTLLTTPGNVLDLPASGGKVSGLVLDTDEDGVGDAMAVDEEATPAMIYGTLSAGKPGAAARSLSPRGKTIPTFAFYFDDADTQQFYFYLKSDETLGITTNPLGPPSDFVFQVSIDSQDRTVISGLLNTADPDATLLALLAGVVAYPFSSEYAGTCDYRPTAQGAVRQCYEFEGAAYSTTFATDFCYALPGGAAVATVSTEERCDPAGASGYCTARRRPTLTGAVSYTFLHVQYSYPDGGADDVKDNCVGEGMEWTDL